LFQGALKVVTSTANGTIQHGEIRLFDHAVIVQRLRPAVSQLAVQRRAGHHPQNGERKKPKGASLGALNQKNPRYAAFGSNDRFLQYTPLGSPRRRNGSEPSKPSVAYRLASNLRRALAIQTESVWAEIARKRGAAPADGRRIRQR